MALFKLSDGGWSKSRTPFKSNYLGSGPSAFSDSTLATITYGESFSDQVVANAPAGSRATRYNITSGSLPSGLVLDSRTGVVSGTSDASESYAFTVTASNPNGSVSESYTGATADAPTWSVNTLGDFTDTVSYSDSVSATARPAATYSVSAGSLPPGISLNTSNGTLSGAPSGVGNAFSFTITATNIAGSVSQSFSGNILQNVPSSVSYLVIAGGGGSGYSQYGHDGGGGAGGYRSAWNGETSGGGAAAESALAITGGTSYTVTVGAGANRNAKGSPSVFSSVSSEGGGDGGIYTSTHNGAAGGSGGGAGGVYTERSYPGVGRTGQGYRGGYTSEFNGATGTAYGGGGGGAAGAGEYTSGYTATRGGRGGAGQTSTITGSSVTRAGGGGGANAGPGGTGGGGSSGNYNTGGGNGATNTGSGGGAGGANSGGKGGSGLVVLRFTGAVPTISAGLSYDPPATVGSDTVIVFKSGTGTVTW